MERTKTKVSLGRKLTRLREGLGISQGQLAERIGISQQMLSKYETTDELDEKTLERISKGLGVSPEFIREYNPSSEKNITNIHGNKFQAGYNTHLGNLNGNDSFNGNHHYHPVEQVAASYQNQIENLKALYERLIEEKIAIIKEKEAKIESLEKKTNGK